MFASWDQLCEWKMEDVEYPRPNLKNLIQTIEDMIMKGRWARSAFRDNVSAREKDREEESRRALKSALWSEDSAILPGTILGTCIHQGGFTQVIVTSDGNEFKEGDRVWIFPKNIAKEIAKA